MRASSTPTSLSGLTDPSLASFSASLACKYLISWWAATNSSVGLLVGEESGVEVVVAALPAADWFFGGIAASAGASGLEVIWWR